MCMYLSLRLPRRRSEHLFLFVIFINCNHTIDDKAYSGVGCHAAVTWYGKKGAARKCSLYLPVNRACNLRFKLIDTPYGASDTRQRSHCLRSRPLQHRWRSSPHHLFQRPPTTRPPQLLRGALRRRVASPTPFKRRLRGAQQSLEVLPSLSSRFTFVPKTGSRISVALGHFSQLYLVQTRNPSSSLVGLKCPPPLATRFASSLLITSIFSAGIVI